MKYITKNIYRSFNECPKKVFFIKENKDEKKELSLIIAEKSDKKVFDKAKELYPNGKEVLGDTIEEKLIHTKELIKEGYETLFNAVFLVEERYF